ncbi:MAG: PAS domain S-box protein, partial [Verrucomicrobiaceae bacterium]
SYLCVPLRARDKTIGVISLVLADSSRQFSERDLAFAEELAARSALAIENARLYRESRESAEGLSTILRSIGDAVIVTDRGGAVKFLNPVAEELTGWSLSEAAGYPVEVVFSLRNEVTGAPVKNPAREALLTGRAAELEDDTVLIARDGAEIPIEDSAAPIRNPQGQIIGAVMVFHDVSQRREKEIALERSQERFRLLGEVVPQILWTSEPSGVVEYFNERWYSYTGKRQDHDEALRWSDVVHPEDYPRTLQAWTASIATGEPYDIEYRLRRYDGEYRWFVGRSVPLRDEAGQITRWYGSCTDIHQQKLTAEALREEYTITEHLHEVAKALATELDLSKVVQFITDAGTRITRAQFGAFFYN